jgi:shikimate kinase
MKIVLVGYMTSGKSVIASGLARKKGYEYIDLDTYIERKEKLKIFKIFDKKGEIYFRKLENDYLKTILESKKNLILSVGGGTPCYSNNMSVIKSLSKSVYLKANIQTLYNRLIREKISRPLVADIPNDKLKEFIAKHLFERSIFYNESDAIVQVDAKTIADIVIELETLLF